MRQTAPLFRFTIGTTVIAMIAFFAMAVVPPLFDFVPEPHDTI